MAEHHIVEIHQQERPGEWSGVCACGMHYKHQSFGPVVLYCEPVEIETSEESHA